ncbi:MAG TPA: DUF2782 domain-containing protein [Gammaproteobacteria bacterium]|nr:DUF2782 domain-containing protein [Gammaproteobacteria bacterium]
MYTRLSLFIIALGLTLATAALAADTDVAELPPPPQPAPASVPGADPAVAEARATEPEPEPELSGEPEVTIVHRDGATVEEYRVNGQLRYARITPSRGAPYYMFDSDGDGALDTRYDDLDNPPINQWILKRW